MAGAIRRGIRRRPPVVYADPQTRLWAEVAGISTGSMRLYPSTSPRRARRAMNKQPG